METIGAPIMIGGVRSVSRATLIGAVEFDITSSCSGRTYRIYAYVAGAPRPGSRLPVIYVTDGNLLFPAAMMQAAYMIDTGEIDPAVIVGIGYPVSSIEEADLLRLWDLSHCTPEAERGAGRLLSLDGAYYGGAEKFLQFITQELEAALGYLYEVDAGNRTLFGHSLGGLLVSYALFTRPEQFRTFVAASPAIWWNGRSLLGELPRFRRLIEERRASPRVLITIGGLEQSSERVRIVPHATTRERVRERLDNERMVDNARALFRELSRIRGATEYSVQFREFEDETHGSVIGATISRALAFALAPRVS